MSSKKIETNPLVDAQYSSSIGIVVRDPVHPWYTLY